MSGGESSDGRDAGGFGVSDASVYDCRYCTCCDCWLPPRAFGIKTVVKSVAVGLVVNACLAATVGCGCVFDKDGKGWLDGLSIVGHEVVEQCDCASGR